jgi:hypothetical protein
MTLHLTRPAVLATLFLGQVLPAVAADPCALLLRHWPQIMGMPINGQPKPSKDMGDQLVCEIHGQKDKADAALTLRMWTYKDSPGMQKFIDSERNGARENRSGNAFADEPEVGKGSYSLRASNWVFVRGVGPGRGVSVKLGRGADKVTDADAAALRTLVREALRQS